MTPAPRAVPPQAIWVLSQRGHGIRAIARVLGVSRNAVRRALRMGSLGPKKRASKLDRFRDKVASLLAKHPRLTVARIEEEIRKDGYDGRQSILKDLVRELRPKTKPEGYDRIETEAGIEAQVDWSPMKVTIDGRLETVQALAVTLCYSRILFVRFYRRNDLASLLPGLIRALRYFGGATVKLVFDNPTSIVAIRLGPVYRFQERLLALSRHYGFAPVAARVARPRDKAKVERPFQDIERAFLYARSFGSLDDLNDAALRWLEAWHARIHGTTGERPVDRLARERLALLPLPAKDFDTRLTISAVVAADFTIAFDGVRYSAPPRLIGERVLVRADEAAVEILFEGTVVARHERSALKRTRVVLEEHRAELRLLRREARNEAIRRRAQGEDIADPDGYDRDARTILEFGAPGEKYLAALVATFRGAARHELRRTLEVRSRLGDLAFRTALDRAAAYGAAGARSIERIAEDLIRRGAVERPAPQPPAPSDAAARPDVPLRPLSYYHDILAAEASATPSVEPEEEGPGDVK